MSLIKVGGGVTDIRGGFGGVYFTRDKSGLHCSPKPRRVHQRTIGQKLQRDAFSAARALSKDNRTVSYLMYRYMNGLEIKPHWDVTGDPIPDCTGRYGVRGQFNGEDYYVRNDSAYFVWYHLPLDVWVISNALGALPIIRWQRPQTAEGTYTPIAEAAGNPIFSHTTYPVPIDYQIPKL